MTIFRFLWRILTSIKTTAIFFILFAIAIAVATFIENDYGVETSWALVYKARWFEILQILLGINLIVCLFKYKMFQKQKIPIFVFHMAFLFILIGAGITRYFGYEGMMNIREGQMQNKMVSSDALLQISDGKNKAERQIYISALGKNKFSNTFYLDGEPVSVTLKNFIRKAQRTLAVSPDGVKVFELVVSTPYGPETYYLENEKMIELGYLNIYYNKAPDVKLPYILISTKEGKEYFSSNYTFAYQTMGNDKISGEVVEGETQEILVKALYNSGSFQMMVKRYEPQGKIKFYSKFNERASLEEQMKDSATPSALFFDISYKGKTQEVVLMGMGKGYQGFSEKVIFDDKSFSLEWGSKQIELPFSLRLNDFIMEKYPGSKSPSSYESQVTLIDARDNINEDRRIYMNHTLIHGGYTFFQSSFDKDERGTVLSVNHDPGKWPTYIGYFFLTIGLLLNLLNPKSQFSKLTKIKYGRSRKMASLFVLLCVSLFNPVSSYAYSNTENFSNMHHLSQEKIADYVKNIDKEHAALFGRVLVQDNGGRIKPINTMAIEMINKVSGGPLLNLNHEQMFLGMVTRPLYWQSLQMFKAKHPDIKTLLKMSDNQDKFSYSDIFDEKGNYKISAAVEDAIRKKPAERGVFDKELIKLDEKLNVAYIIYNGLFFKSFPVKGAKNNQWFTPSETLSITSKETVSEVEDILRLNFEGVNEGYSHGNWSKANQAVQTIIAFQKKYASSVLPAGILIEAELLYNKLLIFEKLFPVYLLSGLLLMLMIFARLLNPNINIKWSIKVVVFVMICGFIVHTFNLGLRWYIAGHAPWSNSYEAMIYIAWTLVLSGIIFARESEFALATTGIFSGITLFVAHLSWLDPQITNLVPVLKSYWLTIHVSVITASYGFLGLSAMLGFITLLLIIVLGLLSNEKIKEQIVTNIKEGTRINQISMIVGLTLLIIGNFLGGVWANESWGRYWGWDPKESWTLITVVIYAAIVHLPYIPRMNNDYVINSVALLGYSTVIMTYFGVNYYLSGLHSYAAGDPIPIPTWLYVTTTFICSLVLIAFFFRNGPKQYKTEKL